MSRNHLKEAGETYFEHLRFAWSVAFVLVVHGLFPNLWEWKATAMMERREMARQEKIRRSRAGYE